MAFRFSLSIECGPSAEIAQACQAHFEGFQVMHGAETWTFQTVAHVLMDAGLPVHWVEVFSLDLPGHGGKDAETQALYGAARRALLARLQGIGGYRLAVPGVESLGAIAYSDFVALRGPQGPPWVVDAEFRADFAGLVVMDGLGLDGLAGFAVGYGWVG